MHKNNYILSKATKLRKLITGSTNLETCMRKYRGETRDGSYVVTPLHAPYNGQRRQRLKVSAKLVLQK